jgi:hypothetical protein
VVRRGFFLQCELRSGGDCNGKESNIDIDYEVKTVKNSVNRARAAAVCFELRTSTTRSKNLPRVPCLGAAGGERIFLQCESQSGGDCNEKNRK